MTLVCPECSGAVTILPEDLEAIVPTWETAYCPACEWEGPPEEAEEDE